MSYRHDKTHWWDLPLAVLVILTFIAVVLLLFPIVVHYVLVPPFEWLQNWWAYWLAGA